MASKLQAENIRYSVNQRNILTDIYLSIEQGEVTGLLGRNGEGKTTLFKIIFGVIDGEKNIRINGETYRYPFEHPSLIRMLPQYSFIPSFLTVSSALEHFNSSFSSLKEIMPFVSFSQKETVSRLSSGERRLLEFFLVISAKSKFALLDEPFLNLSPIQADHVENVIHRFSAEKGILITDQAYQRVLNVSKRLFLLRSGKIHFISDNNDLAEMSYLSPLG